jgi:hypothetical protein
MIEQNWLWVTCGGELLGADVEGVYELEPVAGAGPPWLYQWAPAGESAVGPAAEPGRPRS